MICMMCLSSRQIDSSWFIFFVGVTSMSHLAHFITMMVLRWRHAGKTCSGDFLTTPNRYSLFDAQAPYLHDAGSFLYYAIISQFTLMVAAMAGGGIIGGMTWRV